MYLDLVKNYYELLFKINLCVYLKLRSRVHVPKHLSKRYFFQFDTHDSSTSTDRIYSSSIAYHFASRVAFAAQTTNIDSSTDVQDYFNYFITYYIFNLNHTRNAYNHEAYYSASAGGRMERAFIPLLIAPAPCHRILTIS